MFAGQLDRRAVLKVRGGERGPRRVREAEAKSEADRKRESAPGKVSGDDSWRAPPVPIPNTEVKPPNADGTELGTAWESRKLPGSKRSGRNESFSRSQNIRKNGAAGQLAEAGRGERRSRGGASARQKRSAKPGREPKPSVKAPEADSRPPGRQTSRATDPE